MTTPKYKHLRYEDRYVIQEFLAFGYSFTAIGNRLGKDRRAVSKEVYKHRFLKPGRNKHKLDCPKATKPPYVCNGCPDRTKCLMDQYIYDASIAHNEYEKTLRQQRSTLHISKESIAAINDTIAPLMIHKHHSVNHVYAAHPELLPMSKSTFYRDFQDYMEHNPMASVVEMDTVIGTQGGKGGKCFLTLLFRAFNLMIIRVLPYKKSEYVTQTFEILKTLLGEITFSKTV